MSKAAETVEVCLQEVDRCVPYFIGLLGERYGWHIPKKGKDEVLEEALKRASEKFPFVGDFLDRSVTELEILHGVLMRKNMDQLRAFFYLRDPSYIETLPCEERLNFEDQDGHAKRMLSKLKKYEIHTTIEHPNH